ncbi:MAG: 3'-5' exonuclease [Deltaproteobacteria bacterium]|nr:3'-5' exonuclease [Deltaproteobacteria bacterium]MBW2598359.1 3'-5' exonuclease [Deltaproteobacteria bacterium]MBW2679881.1 3'-5' exonuclease [Deltaproteobacteria bacterium]
MDLKDTKFCVIDLETTGLNTKTDEMIAFACVPVQELKILVNNAYYTLIKPEKYNIESMKYHGISVDDLKNAPSFKEVAHQILEALDGIIVGHSVEFDYRFLKKSFKKIGIKFKKNIIDIVLIEKWLAKKTNDPELDLTIEGLMNLYELNDYYRHNAFADAFFTAQIFQFETLKLSRYGIDSAKKLLKIVNKIKYSNNNDDVRLF